VLVVVAIPFALQAPAALRSGGFIRPDLESAQAKALLEREIGVPEAAVVIVFHSETARAGEPAFEAAAGAAIAGVPQAEYVRAVLPHTLSTRQVSPDGHTAYDVVLLDLPADDSPKALPGLRAAIQQQPGLEVGLSGGPAFYGDVQEVSEADLRRCRSPRWRCCWCSDPSSRQACRWWWAGPRSWWRSPRSSSSRASRR
jgi:hypothetical protein